MRLFKLSKRVGYLLALVVLGLNQLTAQSDSIPKLIISEVKMTDDRRIYLELANVGDSAINLKHFEVGTLVQFGNAFSHVYTDGFAYQTMLPDYVLSPGQTYFMAVINDETDLLYDPTNLPEDGSVSLIHFTPVDWLPLIDFPIYRRESMGPNDSISTYGWLLRNFNGSNGNYLEYHNPVTGDSMVIDVVKANIQANNRIQYVPVDIAGVFQASKDHVLIRKTYVKTGNTDWEQSRGVGPEDSEWIVIPFSNDDQNPRQRSFTTIKHHGESQINESTFRTAGGVIIDFEDDAIQVPYGVYRDSFMFEFVLGKGLAWHYDLVPQLDDSTYLSVRTGDVLTVWGVGDSLKEKKFELTALSPPADENRVLPKLRRHISENAAGIDRVFYTSLFRVTENVPTIDSILDISFSLRVDTLLKYLEIPKNAKHEIIWVDGVSRPDLKRGDILRVTAENGSIKDYFLAVETAPEPGTNTLLADINWPDVPEITRLSTQWNGGYTIPGFNQGIFTYIMRVPYGFNKIPGLIALAENLNSTVSVQRATNLNGTVMERTTHFMVKAENGEEQVYSVLFEKDLPDVFIQPLDAEPIITQITYRQMVQNNFIEISNPGNREMDLSRYMITAPRGGTVSNPADVITLNAANFGHRYQRIVPGYDYVSSEEWGAKMGHLELDPSVNSYLAPSETFVIGYMKATAPLRAEYAAFNDIIFDHTSNDFNLSDVPGTTAKIIPYSSITSCLFDRPFGVLSDPIGIYKILNDSILEGTKGIGDPTDFRLVEIIGDYTNTGWNVNGEHIPLEQNQNITRKSRFWKADTILNYSFGPTPDSSQWDYIDRAMLVSEGYNNNMANRLVASGIGFHQFEQINTYKSTIASVSYIVSDGYATPQSIIGVDINTTKVAFLNNIIKADSGQVLQLINGITDLPLEDGVALSDKDKLVVTSADGKNTTTYIVTVTDGGLDNNAVITSSLYDITVNGQIGSINGIVFGSSVIDVLNNIQKPQTSTLTIIDISGSVVPESTINFDTIIVETQASHLVSFEVVAQDNETKIVYSLNIETGLSDAMLFSDMYSVDQLHKMVSGIPDGTRVHTLFTHLKPIKGATVKLFDKAGNERTLGNVAYDDKVQVSSADGTRIVTYYLQFFMEKTGASAYLLSDEYVVDQVGLQILGAKLTSEVTDFMSKLTASEGASLMLVNTQGNEVSEGNLLDGYRVKVTSGNGNTVVYYSIEVNTSIGKVRNNAIAAYPNPTRDNLFISGLQAGSTVTLYTLAGEVVLVKKAEDIEGGFLSLSGKPSGVYFLSVKLNGISLNTIKVVKK